MSEGKRTPGPFSREHSPIASDEVIFRQTGEAGKVGSAAVPICRPVALLYETMDEAERAELVDLLNKGTHYDGMLAALKDLYDAVAFPRQGGCVGTMKAAAAAIAAAESRRTEKEDG